MANHPVIPGQGGVIPLDSKSRRYLGDELVKNKWVKKSTNE